MNTKNGHQELSDVEREAIAWLVTLDGDDPLSQRQRDELEEWLGRSPAHRRALNEANRFWSNSILTELIVPLAQPQKPLLLRLMQSWREQLSQLIRPPAVAVLSLIIVVGIAFTFLFNEPADITVYSTNVGQQQVVTLTDGSIAHLNTDTQLKVQYTRSARVLRLVKGEVHFNVSSNPSRPFQVYGGDAVVEAIGTAFTVSLLEKQMDVLVTEGLVKVSAQSAANTAPQLTGNQKQADHSSYDIRAIPEGIEPKRLATLSAGQKLSIAQAIEVPSDTYSGLGQSPAITTLTQLAIEQHEAWRRGVLIFSGQPLIEAIEQISRFTQVEIEIADPELRNLQIGGRFPVGDVEAMLASLEANFDVDIDRGTLDKIIIKSSKETNNR